MRVQFSPEILKTMPYGVKEAQKTLNLLERGQYLLGLFNTRSMFFDN